MQTLLADTFANHHRSRRFTCGTVGRKRSSNQVVGVPTATMLAAVTRARWIVVVALMVYDMPLRNGAVEVLESNDVNHERLPSFGVTHLTVTTAALSLRNLIGSARPHPATVRIDDQPREHSRYRRRRHSLDNQVRSRSRNKRKDRPLA
jgi:hypothetical protein